MCGNMLFRILTKTSCVINDVILVLKLVATYLLKKQMLNNY